MEVLEGWIYDRGYPESEWQGMHEGQVAEQNGDWLEWVEEMVGVGEGVCCGKWRM